jgi:hypothetical protein
LKPSEAKCAQINSLEVEKEALDANSAGSTCVKDKQEVFFEGEIDAGVPEWRRHV